MGWRLWKLKWLRRWANQDQRHTWAEQNCTASTYSYTLPLSAGSKKRLRKSTGLSKGWREGWFQTWIWIEGMGLRRVWWSGLDLDGSLLEYMLDVRQAKSEPRLCTGNGIVEREIKSGSTWYIGLSRAFITLRPTIAVSPTPRHASCLKSYVPQPSKELP